MKKTVLLALSLLVIVIIGIEWLLPLAVERLLAKSIGSDLGTGEISVKLDLTPGYHVLFGHLDHLIITANHLNSPKFTAEQLSIDVRDLRLTVSSLLNDRRFVLQSVGAGRAALVMTDQDVSNCLQRNVKEIKNPVAQITPQRVQISGSFTLGPAVLKATLDGQVTGSDSLLRFTARQVAVGNGKFGAAMNQEFTLYDLKQLPVPMMVEDVTQQNGSLVVVASTGGAR